MKRWVVAGKEASSLESRRVATWPYYLFAIAAGAMLPIQFGVNAQLARYVDSPLRRDDPEIGRAHV